MARLSIFHFLYALGPYSWTVILDRAVTGTEDTFRLLMQLKLMLISFRKLHRWIIPASLLVIVSYDGLPQCSAQTVQLPNYRKFSLHNSHSVPDQGSVQSGRNNASHLSRTSRPGQSGFSSSQASNGATVHATVIDLDELDRMIRCQCEDRASKIRLPSLEKSQTHRHGTVARTKPGVKETPASYDYLLAMSHTDHVTANKDQHGNLSDARYYLNYADRAVRNREWSNAEFYYKLAWENLPANRRTQAVLDLLEARAARITASQDLATKKVR